MHEMMQQPEGGAGMKQFGPARKASKNPLMKEIQNFLTQQAHRVEASRDINERMVQALAELGRLAHGYIWNEAKSNLTDHWAHLFVLLYGTCIQQNIDIDSLVSEYLKRLPSTPTPARTKERARGLRL